MTTIAIKENIIAYDGRETLGSTIIRDDVDKKIKHRGRQFILCGNVDQYVPFMDACIDGGSDKDFQCSGLMIEDGVVYEVFASAVPCEYEGHPLALGSGADHALTSMDLGLSAKEAVMMSAKRDVNTGGKIRTFKVNRKNKVT